jgi:Protein of unknown function (DUF4238)
VNAIMRARTVLHGKKSHLVSINDATVIKDFYSVTMPSGEISDFFERRLGDVEKVAANAFTKMLDENMWPIEGEDRFAITSWIALQYLRSESVGISQNEIKADLIRLVVGSSGKRALKQHIEHANRQSPGDRYKKRVVRKSTGEVLRDEDEPLDQHEPTAVKLRREVTDQ